jgi:ribosome recycling factor
MADFTLDDVLLESDDKMDKAIGVFKDTLRGMRTGRANPALVENVRVEYYGAPTPLKQLASIGAPEPNLLVVKPFDPSSVSNIEKAILKSDLGLTPSNDGKLIRLVIPALSEETRRQLVNRVKDLAEEARISVRNIRKDAMRRVESLEDTPGVSEDDIEKAKEDVQEFVENHNKQVEELVEKKTKELMEI